MLTPDINTFKPVTAADRAVFKQYFSEFPSRYCDLNFVNLVAWNGATGASWTEFDNRLYIYFSHIDSILLQIGKDVSPNYLLKISQDLQKSGKSGRISLVKPEYIESNRLQLEKSFIIEEDRDFSDYIYSSKKLSLLSGKKLTKKKNLVNQFRRYYPDYVVRPLTSADKDTCLELTQTWSDLKDDIDPCMEYEIDAIQETWDHFNELGVEGLLILVDNQPVAYSIFSWQSHDTVDIHFEKYNRQYKGSGQIINQETASYLKDKFKYLNREQDLDIEGLKKAKMSYDPDHILKAYSLNPINNEKQNK